MVRQKLVAARRQAGLSQTDLAQELGTSQTNVSRWEQGKVTPSAYYRKKLCSYFHMTPTSLGLDDWDQELQAAEQEYIDNLPLIDQGLIGRDLDLMKLRQLLAQGHRLVALYGLPGVGKTALAVALARDREIRERFPDGVLWAGLGERPNKSNFRRWGRVLGITEVEQTGLRSDAEWGAALRNAIGSRRLLLLIDDAWSEQTALSFKIGGPYCAHVVTTRFPALASSIAPDAVMAVRELGEEQGLLLLRTLVPGIIDRELQQARTLIRAVGGLPLALKLTGNYLRREGRNLQPRRIQAALARLLLAENRLRLEQPSSLDEPHALLEDAPISLYSLLAVSDRHLSPPARAALYALGVLVEKPATFSEETALTITGCTSEILDELNDAGFLETSGTRYTLHQVVADYARCQLKLQSEDRVKEIYRRLVEYALEYALTYQGNLEKLDRECFLYRTALEAADARGYHMHYVRLAAALATYIRVYLIYGVEPYLSRAIALAQTMDRAQVYSSLIKLLEEQSRLRWYQRDRVMAEQLAREGLHLAEEAGDAMAGAVFCNLLNREELDPVNQPPSQQSCGPDHLSSARLISLRGSQRWGSSRGS